MTTYKQHLEDGKPARSTPVQEEEKVHVADLFLLTAKPVLYVCNVDEASVVDGNEHVDAVRKAVAEENAEVLTVAAALEADIAELDDAEERQIIFGRCRIAGARC